MFSQTSPSPSGIGTLLGNGDGTFVVSPTVFSMFFPRHVATGDFNEDGRDDVIAVAGFGGTSYLRSNGDGTYAPTLIGGSGGVIATAVGDVNGDGNLDVVGAEGLANQISVFLGSGTGTFSAPALFPAGSVTITGANLGNATVTFGGLPATVVSNDGTTLVVTTPPHTPGTFPVVVTTPSGSATGSFTFVAAPPGPGQGFPRSGPWRCWRWRAAWLWSRRGLFADRTAAGIPVDSPDS